MKSAFLPDISYRYLPNLCYNIPMASSIIEWNAPEHHHVEKTSDWYWAVGIVAVTAALVAFIFGNIIFGIFIVVGACALMLHASKYPAIVHCTVNDRGISVDDTLYPFLSLESFWINIDDHDPKIILKSRKAFMPYITIHIDADEVNPEDIRDILLDYIAETEHREPISQKLLERMGF